MRKLKPAALCDISQGYAGFFVSQSGRQENSSILGGHSSKADSYHFGLVCQGETRSRVF